MSILGNPVCLPIGGKAAKGSRMFLGVTLPRSIYYEQAAEWLKIKDNVKADIAETQWDGQVVCGNSLWEIYGNNAYSYSLETGDLLETISLKGIENSPCCSVATDGINRIWILRVNQESPKIQSNAGAGSYWGMWTYSHTLIVKLYEFDVSSKSVKELTTQQVSDIHTFSNQSTSNPATMWTNPNVQLYCGSGLMGYSKASNKVYFGSIPLSSSGGQIRYYQSSGSGTLTTIPDKNFYLHVWEYDLFNTTAKEIKSIPASEKIRGRYFYDEEDFFYIGNGYSTSVREKKIFRYNKQSDTWETISTNFEGYSDGHFTYIALGDKMLQISQTATGIFDPKTGNLEPMTVPVIPPDNTVMYPGFQAYSNNILYLVNSQGVYKCPFFSSIPDDAPIVCKIYKGQKYHTLEPFEIPNKIKLLRTQQIAEQDIEIKMYEYASEGGQTIFIEDIGE